MDDDEVTPTRQIVTREQAKLAGHKTYFTGQPCRRGHIDVWATSNNLCAQCNRDRVKKWIADNPEKAKASHRDYNATHKLERAAWRKARGEVQRAICRIRSARWVKNNPERHRAQQHRWKRDNKEQRRISARRYYLANTEKIAQYGRAYSIAHRDKGATNSRNYKARLRAVEGHHTSDDVKAIFVKQKGKCVACLKKLGKKYDVDHKVAVFNGGTNWPSNLQLLCVYCNRSKSAKDRYKWAQEQGLLCI